MFNRFEYMEIGPTPFGEDCAQVGDPDYAMNAKMECNRYIELLNSLFPQAADVNAFFSVKSFPHDFGTYYEVCVNFDPEDTKSVDFAYNVDANLPEFWRGR